MLKTIRCCLIIGFCCFTGFVSGQNKGGVKQGKWSLCNDADGELKVDTNKVLVSLEKYKSTCFLLDLDSIYRIPDRSAIRVKVKVLPSKDKVNSSLPFIVSRFKDKYDNTNYNNDLDNQFHLDDTLNVMNPSFEFVKKTSKWIGFPRIISLKVKEKTKLKNNSVNGVFFVLGQSNLFEYKSDIEIYEVVITRPNMSDIIAFP